MLQERKNRMLEVQKRISKELARLKSHAALNSNLSNPLFDMFDRRIDSIGVRSFFADTLHRYILQLSQSEGQKLKSRPSILFDTQLPLLAEGIITVQYLENQLLDGKDNTRTCDEVSHKRQRDQKLIAGHYLKDALYDYIDREVMPDDPGANRLVATTVRKIFRYVDLGQMMQDEWGSYEWFVRGHKSDVSISSEVDDFIDSDMIRSIWKIMTSKGLDARHLGFMRNYLRRIYLTSGALFVLLAELEMDLLGYQGSERENIKKGAAVIGIIGQMANDICDFLPHTTPAKGYEDVFSDIRNDIITLPLAIYFSNYSNVDLKGLQYLAAEALSNLSNGNWEGFASTPIAGEMASSLLMSMEIGESVRENFNFFFKDSILEGHLLENLNSIINWKQNPIFKGLYPQLEDWTVMQRLDNTTALFSFQHA